MSTNEKDTAISKNIAVLIPVLVGSLLGLTASLATNYYTSRVERNETLRKERAQHIERAMMLLSKFTNDVSKAISLGLNTKGNTGANDISVLVAPTDTLTELNATVSLYFPQPKSDVEEIIGAYSRRLHFDLAVGDSNKAPEGENYSAAMSYLSLLYDEPTSTAHVEKIKRVTVSCFKAKDIFRASGLSLLGVGNSHVKKDRKKIKTGRALSPLLLVRDTANSKVIIADGYHRLCAVYSYDEDAVIPCKIA